MNYHHHQHRRVIIDNSKFVIAVVVVIEPFVIHNEDIIRVRVRTPTRARTIAYSYKHNKYTRQDKINQNKRGVDILPDLIDEYERIKGVVYFIVLFCYVP